MPPPPPHTHHLTAHQAAAPAVSDLGSSTASSPPPPPTRPSLQPLPASSLGALALAQLLLTAHHPAVYCAIHAPGRHAGVGGNVASTWRSACSRLPGLPQAVAGRWGGDVGLEMWRVCVWCVAEVGGWGRWGVPGGVAGVWGFGVCLRRGAFGWPCFRGGGVGAWVVVGGREQGVEGNCEPFVQRTPPHLPPPWLTQPIA